MRTLLVIVLLFGINLTCERPFLYGQKPSEMKNWQVRGMARSAIRINDYNQSAIYLEEWYKRNPSNDKVGTQLARIYLKSREYEKAETLFKNIYEKDTRNNLDALFYYAQIQKTYGNYDEALELFDILRRQHKRVSGKNINRARIEREIAGCQKGINARDTITSTEIKRFNESINTPLIEFGPILISDTEFIYGSIKDDAPRYINLNEEYAATKQFYRASLINNEWHGGKNVEAPFYISEKFDTGRGAFSVDKQRFYSSQCFINHKGKNICHLYVSRLEDDEWTEPEKLDKTVNHPRHTSTQPAVGTCFDNSLEVLYFVSDRPGGAGGMDIWFSVYDKRDKKYRKAENAGVFINTPQDEITPFFDLPSHRLYYSSNGWPGYGGFDVFYAKGNMVTWSQSVNVGPPVNSSYDDVDYTQNRSGKFGLLASNRPHNNAQNKETCCDNLYAFYENKSPRVLITGRLVSEDRFEEKLLDKRPEIPQLETYQPEVLRNRQISIELNHGSESSVFLQEITTNEDGEFEIWVDPGMDYTINVADSTLLERSFLISTKNSEQDETIEMSTVSLNIIPQRAIVVNNIYYEFNQTELSAQAKEAIDSTLLLMLNEYPHIKVEISSHTDNLGQEEYNQSLSELRAKNVINYLISKNISSTRLTAKGYGQTKPLAENQHANGSDNAEGRQQNRRTEFKITGLVEQ